jgi:hypothetical protein
MHPPTPGPAKVASRCACPHPHPKISLLVLGRINNRYMGRRVRARGLQTSCRPRALTRRYRELLQSSTRRPPANLEGQSPVGLIPAVAH